MGVFCATKDKRNLFFVCVCVLNRWSDVSQMLSQDGFLHDKDSRLLRVCLKSFFVTFVVR